VSLALEVGGRKLPLDDRRGTTGMQLLILTEALLFVVLFFAYFYLGRDETAWPTLAPKLRLALVMLGLLAASSVVLWAGERALRRGRVRAARGALLGTIALGVLFLVVQGFEYAERLKRLRPTSDAYGSIFYTITSFHAAHLVVGLLALGFVAALPELEPTSRSPHRPLHNAALYWHFVDAVWLVIVGLLYVLPNLER
jgi:heme/copper-type cytochrome/quinol oxidase subunit 3